ncbi:MAG: NUDIX domain-containing protein [Candidatus Aminicenantes bacterium]|nr:NUDIX domain-containing protein [Candidatus Aminicenantes bacterium]NIM80083.1 NUDIX domain-containing protein [Candidatus Aminicenantes bacterium]NIN19425.1 NUDIX domain-containing protein [Candidatus Aminicenantes bacterium]NIN43324.1 NUDIX domain-containing protein [Candidatus Aminicenantes bacterium]NIN86068.1 NUDIX domain-containing protein [Candidatus Aminicenantes bacterium]
MKKVEIERKRRVFDDFFKIEEAFVRYEKFDGQMSDRVRRLNFERGDAAAVLIFNRETQRIILVQQFRFPTYEKGDGWMIEVVAGILGKDEKPEEAVRREVLEETGYRVSELTPISTFYLSPGGSSERIFLYYAEVVDSDKVASGGGVETEHEDIRILEYSLPETWQAWQAGEIKDAKTIIALMWLRSRVNRGSKER